MTICSPEACNIARERSPSAMFSVEGEQIVMSPSHKSNNCFILPIFSHFHVCCGYSKIYMSLVLRKPVFGVSDKS